MNILLILLLTLAGVGFAQGQVEIGSAQLSLKFAADGKPKSFRSGDRELLDEKDPGNGFELKGFDYTERKPVSFPLKDITLNGKQLTASMGENVRITFDVKATDRYITLRIRRVEGVPKSNLLWLQFGMNVKGLVKTLPLDYMTRSNTDYWENSWPVGNKSMAKGSGATLKPKDCEVRWPWLWARSENTPLGGFAIYAPTSAEDDDETLLHIWANEGLPHSRVQGEWNVAAARKWVADWQAQFADQSQMLITAKTNEELYTLTDYAAQMDIKRIYMHTDTWRGEYWPTKYGFLHLNPLTFPKGEADFQAFAKYAKSKGIGLTIHTVSCSIANNDPDYGVGKLDSRLAKWVEGTLAKSISGSEQTILFQPKPGSEMPLLYGRPVTGPVNVDPWNNIRIIRLGDELIEVGEFTDTDKAVWVLKNCRRGAVGTTVVAHAAKSPITGLIRPYGQVFTADNDSTLVAELGRRIAEFYNRNNVIHCEQDAAEIHTVNRPWGYRKFSEAVYTNLDHPVTSNDSGGRPMACQLEYFFNSSRAAVAAREKANVPLMISRNGRLSTGPYEMFALLGKAVASGRVSVGIGKPEPMFGVSTEILEKHGGSALAMETVLTWKKIAPLLGEEQRKTILAANDAVIYRASKAGANYEIVPLRMLYRPGIDIGWKSGSEFGPIVPRQYIKAGETLRVENPFSAQEPEFVIRVMNGFMEAATPTAAAAAKPTGSDSKESALIESYNIGAGIPAAGTEASPGKTSAPNAELTAKNILNSGDHQFTDEGQAIRVRFENMRNEAIVNDDNLPYWNFSSNMANARGIGLTVTGDGSGAVLVVQAHCAGPRDYVVPLDFKGEREIVIPSGEVSWGDARWGWRFATKDTKYGSLKKLSFGLGKVPPNTTVDIKVRNLRILPEIQTQLINPVIAVGSGTMEIVGTIKSGSYLWYRGGETVGVFDENWQKVADLPVVKNNFSAPPGKLEIRVESKQPSPTPWLECQFFVKDQPMAVNELARQSTEGKP